VDSVEEVAGRISEYLEMRMPEGLIGKLKMLPKLAEMGAFFPKVVSRGPCQEIVKTVRVFALRLPGAHLLAGRWRAVYHAAHGFFEESGIRKTQLRHVPPAGVR